VNYRNASVNDCPWLAGLNQQLIEDEGHRNPTAVPELEDRLRQWLVTEYYGIIFEENGLPVAYAIYREEKESIYLRQFFVMRERRRIGVGRRAMNILLTEIWPKGKRRMVEVLFNNRPAVEFWKSIGYREYSLAMEILPEKAER
jgi:GNAT superfamily N-acetyltransferase